MTQAKRVPTAKDYQKWIFDALKGVKSITTLQFLYGFIMRVTYDPDSEKAIDNLITTLGKGAGKAKRREGESSWRV